MWPLAETIGLHWVWWPFSLLPKEYGGDLWPAESGRDGKIRLRWFEIYIFVACRLRTDKTFFSYVWFNGLLNAPLCQTENSFPSEVGRTQNNELWSQVLWSNSTHHFANCLQGLINSTAGFLAEIWTLRIQIMNECCLLKAYWRIIHSWAI
jgi:hypothetical protein